MKWDKEVLDKIESDPAGICFAVRLNTCSKRELEFGLCKTRVRVPED